MSKRELPIRWQDCQTDEDRSAYLAANPVDMLVARGEFRPVEMWIDARRKQDAYLHIQLDQEAMQQLKLAAETRGMSREALVRLWLAERLQDSDPA